MAGPSNLPPHVSPRIQEVNYLHAINANVSNFVSVKLSSKDDYHPWKTQMLCLMETHDMRGLVDAAFDRSSSTKIMKQYDSLLRGWIFGSISQRVLGTVLNLGSAKEVWDKLKSFYAPNISSEQETKNKDVVSGETETKEETKGKDISMEQKPMPIPNLPKKQLKLPPGFLSKLREETKGKDISIEIEAKEETKGKGISMEVEGKEETKGKGISMEVEGKEETKGKGISMEIEAKEETKGKGISMEVEGEEETKGKGISMEIEAKEETKGKDISIETETKGKGSSSSETKNKDVVSGETETKEDHVTISMEQKPPIPNLQKKKQKVPPHFLSKLRKDEEKQQEKRNKNLEEATKKGNWDRVSDILKIDRYGLSKLDPINKEKSTILHLAAEKGHDDFVESLIGSFKKEEDIKGALEMKNVHGSTALHVAAILGNKSVVELLIKNHKELCTISDKQGHDPLYKACSSLQFGTCLLLLDALKNKDNKGLSDYHINAGVGLLVNAISAKRYRAALIFIKKYPEFATGSDQVLMAIARTFPSGLSHEETETVITCTDLGEIGNEIIESITKAFLGFILYWRDESCYRISDVPRMLLIWVWRLIFFFISFMFLPFVMLYFVLWMCATKVGNNIDSYLKPTKKQKEWAGAKEVLKVVCDEIDKLKSFEGTHHPHYKGPILEAACQNAYEVVDEILSRCPQAIKCKDDCGYDIIQLAVIHRSDKIYSRIYQIGKGNNQYYKTIKDSSQNNMLHLAGRLAPSHKLNRITGAALQLQWELQWREELKKFVFPSYITQENIYKETPGMVFTREHENLVKEGETWMKTTAESCSITAGLITTIVFAAAITVPGGSNQEKGTPLFSHEIAFLIFAISDAISLFTSTITLLVFLSILTARFSEQDFLVNLPRRLIIGLCALLISTTAMMVAFGTILFLVFCNRKPWLLIPICVSVCLTIVFSFIIQIPLILDLCRSTYVPIFGKKNNSQEAENKLIELINDIFFSYT